VLRPREEEAPFIRMMVWVTRWRSTDGHWNRQQT
jgi:hypothetical protein